jgi:hypothetical protein
MHAAAASCWAASHVEPGPQRHIEHAGANQTPPVQSLPNVLRPWPTRFWSSLDLCLQCVLSEETTSALSVLALLLIEIIW